MINSLRVVSLGEFLSQRKEYFTIDDFVKYKRARVQSHGQGIVLRDEVYGSEIKTKKQQVARTGEFLVAEIDAKVGGFGIVPPELDDAVVSSHYFLFQIDQSKCSKEWLHWFVRYNSLEEQTKAQGSTNYAAIRPSDVLNFEIPLPPLTEQRRIVVSIKALAGRIAEAQSLRQSATEEAEVLFSSAATNIHFDEKIWKNVEYALSKHKRAIHSGPFGSSLTHDEFVESGVAAIGTRDIQVNKFSLSSGWYVTPERFEELKQYQTFPGDVLVTIIGGSIGRFCVVPEDAPTAFTTKHVVAMQFNPKLADRRFASYMLNFHARCRETMFSQTAGSAQPSLNISKIKAIEFPVPSLDEQHRIVAYLDGLSKRVNVLRRLQAESQVELDALLPSILDRAFKGEL